MVLGMESWFYNFSQMSRRWNSPETLADIPRPHLEQAIWGMFKGAEISAAIGGLLAHPVYRWWLKRQLTPETTTPNSQKIIRNRARRLQGRFLLAGLALGPAASLLHTLLASESEMDVRKRCYAVRCDQPSMTIDRCVFVGGFVGWYWKRFQGAVDGINIGLAYGLFNNHVLEKYTSPLLKDKVRPEEQFASLEEALAKKTRLQRLIDGDGTEKA